jgi:hypothetical protein
MSSLLRYFASKSDLVWQAIGTSFSDLPEDPEITRPRMRIISRTAELHSSSSPQFIAWRTIIRDFAAQHLGVPAADRTRLSWRPVSRRPRCRR